MGKPSLVVHLGLQVMVPIPLGELLNLFASVHNFPYKESLQTASIQRTTELLTTQFVPFAVLSLYINLFM